MYVCVVVSIIVVCLIGCDVCWPYSVVGPALDVDNITEKLPDTFKVGSNVDLCSNTYMYTNTVMLYTLPPPLFP